MPPSKETTSFRPKARRPRGLMDRRGAHLAAERALIARVAKVYGAWGFEELETSAFEYADALGKFLPDQDRPNEGVFSLQDDDEQWLALRYDLTAPLARYVAENFDALPKPFRRWAAGPVWRNEKPGPGRFREFWQCDADSVGAPGPEADAEMVAMACEALVAAGAPRGSFRVNVSTRRLLDGCLELIGVPADDRGAALRVLRSIDKLDRLGWEGVVQLLGPGRKDESGDFTAGAGLNSAQIDIVRAIFNSPPTDAVAAPEASLDQLARAFGGRSAKLDAAFAELAAIMQIVARLADAAREVAIAPSVVRGLEYYTGPVFEAELLMAPTEGGGARPRFGSVGGGGRYDDLVARFRGERIPATGFSIGVSRLAAALAASRPAEAEVAGPIVVLPFDKDGMGDCFSMAQILRAADIPAEVYLGGSGPKAQLRYADRRAAPIAVILGGDERAAAEVTLKDLKLGAELAKSTQDNKEWRESGAAQIRIPQADLVAAVRAMLERQA